MRPPVLHLVAPARALVRGPDYSEVLDGPIDECVRWFRDEGWTVVESANLRRIDRRFAGSDAERADGLMKAFLDPGADAVVALRGGYGTTRLLPLLDWDALRGSRARLVGLSDITALSMALLARAGLPSWQGSVAWWFSEPDPANAAALRQALGRRRWRLRVPVRGADGACEGTLWGGNLSILASLAGTPWMPRVDGGILFVEDVAEPAWRIERMLLQLADAGILARQKALLVGQMSGSEAGEGRGAGRFSLEDALEWIARRTGLPVISGLPFGHRRDSILLPVGVEARVRVAGGVLTAIADRSASCARAPAAWRR